MINNLKEEFPEYVIGLSDHTMNVLTPAFAHALGANVIEKHYTIDNFPSKFDRNSSPPTTANCLLEKSLIFSLEINFPSLPHP